AYSFTSLLIGEPVECALSRLTTFPPVSYLLSRGGPHQGQGQHGGHCIESVSTGETGRIQQWEESDCHGEVRRPVGGAGDRQRCAAIRLGNILPRSTRMATRPHIREIVRVCTGIPLVFFLASMT